MHTAHRESRGGSWRPLHETGMVCVQRHDADRMRSSVHGAGEFITYYIPYSRGADHVPRGTEGKMDAYVCAL